LACADTDEIEQQRETYISSRMTPLTPLTKGIEILEGALAIGRAAEPLELPVVEARMSAVKANTRTATSQPDKPLLATIKNLLSAFWNLKLLLEKSCEPQAGEERLTATILPIKRE
jgi:hypothetical protein